MGESIDSRVVAFRNALPCQGESPYPDIATIVKLGIDGNLDGLWKEIVQFADKDPAYGYIENVAAHYGWGRERLATVLAAAFLIRSEDWRRDMAAMGLKSLILYHFKLKGEQKNENIETDVRNHGTKRGPS